MGFLLAEKLIDGYVEMHPSYRRTLSRFVCLTDVWSVFPIESSSTRSFLYNNAVKENCVFNLSNQIFLLIDDMFYSFGGRIRELCERQKDQTGRFVFLTFDSCAAIVKVEASGEARQNRATYNDYII